MLRQAILDDTPQVLELLEEFYTAVTGSTVLPQAFTDQVSYVIEHGIAIVSDTDDGIQGVIAGTVDKVDLFATTVCTEQVWFARDNSGGRLLRRFLAEAEARGATQVLMSVLTDAGDRTHKLVEHFGGTPVETHYRFNLENRNGDHI